MKLYYLHLAFQICLFMIILTWQQVDCSGNQTDRLALLEIKKGITSDPHNVLRSWNDSFHMCNWFGVSCGRRHMRVVSLVLQSQSLKGSLSPYVGNLSFLRILDVQNNTLHGQIPSEVGSLFRLEELYVNNNSIGGEIPSKLINCSRLRRFILQVNNLSGKIPVELGNFKNLEVFAVGKNNLTGEIPASLGNLSSLAFFSVGQNNLAGNIPPGLGKLTNLYFFSASINNLSGVIPPSLFNTSSLEVISLVENQLEGNLPENLGLTLPNIQSFSIAVNRFSGLIPNSFSNASRLEAFDIGENHFTGQVPNSLGSLKNLLRFQLNSNNLGNNSTQSWGFLASLTNCSSLTILDLGRNNFGGVLPDFIGNLSNQLIVLYAGGNQISGTIPTTLENLSNLIALSMSNNFFSGTLPSYIGKFKKLQLLYFTRNRLSGPIPSSIGNLSNLYHIDLTYNKLEGSIPASITNCTSLQSLLVSQNRLNGSIPKEFLRLSSILTVLRFSDNFLTGNLPVEFGKLTNMYMLDVSGNRLSGQIPQSIGECSSLEYLYLLGNSFHGKIPSAFSSLKGLQELDLSQNNLTGEIPPDFQNLTYLLYLNLSLNDLEGEVPTRGVFRNLTAFSIVGNDKLCGGVFQLHLPKCRTKPMQKEKHHALKLAVIIASVVLFVVLAATFLLIHNKRRPKKNTPVPPFLLTDPHVEVSYRDLHQATSGFSSDNLIGSGSFGSVYKGYLDKEERLVAIKVLKLEENGALKSFMAECKALRSVRHRNLVKLLTYCSSLDYQGNEFKALVFEFMGNGSLEKWLDHQNQPNSLNFLQKLNIAIDVASALHYLHDLCEGTIIHHDLKPSNVLLDDELVAHLSDFGLAKLFFTINDGSQSQISSIGLKGTIGYAPPEYGMGGMASKEGDVYSFGILVLELFSGKNPTDEMFINGSNLRDLVKYELSREREQEEVAGTSNTDQTESLLAIFKIGLACSAENPRERKKMGEVVKELHFIRSNFLGIRIYG